MRNLTLLFVAIVALLSSCKKDEAIKKTLEIPSTYDSTNFDINPAKDAAKILKDMIVTFENNRPSNGNVKEITYHELVRLYSTGNPSPFDIGSSNFSDLLLDYFFWQYNSNSDATSKGAVIDWGNLDASPRGGAAGDYIFNKNQVNIEQLIVKGSLAGISFNHVAKSLFKKPDTLTNVHLHAALELYGSNPAFDQYDLTAKYAKDRKKGSGTYHDAINLEFRKAQGAINQNLKDEKEKAIQQILLLWEEALAAQTIYNMNDVLVSFNKTNITNEDLIEGCHAWSKSVGILLGFLNINEKKISDNTVLALIQKLSATEIGIDRKPVYIVGEPFYIKQLVEAINTIAATYELNPEEHKRPI